MGLFKQNLGVAGVVVWAVAALAVPGRGGADEPEQPRVAIEKMRYPGAADSERTPIVKAIEDGVKSAGAERSSDANHKYAFGKSKELFTDECLANDQCWLQAAQLLNVPMTLSGILTHKSDGWEADLSLYATDLARVGKRAQFACPSCSVETFADRVRDTVNDMVRWNLRTQRAVMLVHTQPPSADVRIDGRSVGKSPVEVNETAGQHDVSASAPDREERHAVVDLTPKGRIEVEIKLSPKMAPPPVVPPAQAETWSPRNLKIAGWVLVGASVVGIVVGAALVGIDGHEIGRHANQSGIWVKDVYTTASAGGAIIGIGAAIGIVSAVPFYFSKKKESAKLKVMLTPTSGAVAVEGAW